MGLSVALYIKYQAVLLAIRPSWCPLAAIILPLCGSGNAYKNSHSLSPLLTISHHCVTIGRGNSAVIPFNNTRESSNDDFIHKYTTVPFLNNFLLQEPNTNSPIRHIILLCMPLTVGQIYVSISVNSMIPIHKCVTSKLFQLHPM